MTIGEKLLLALPALQEASGIAIICAALVGFFAFVSSREMTLNAHVRT